MLLVIDVGNTNTTLGVYEGVVVGCYLSDDGRRSNLG